MFRRIGEATSFLAYHPNVGRSGRVEGTRELIVSGTPYIVIYSVANSRVEIITILHAAQRWPNTSD
ncbi:type II toxin-antitoxin system RelE/ParE family toxin [Rhizobium sp. SL42]|nr:type II toxin-antitoxin system RelE/ParE family toxin [Rhizobium sp. SL42]